MSYEEPRVDLAAAIESRSKVKLTRNAKGDPQWEISIIEGASPDEIERLRKLAVATHNALLDELMPR